VTLDEQATTRLAELEANGLRREPRTLRDAHGAIARLDDRRIAMLSSNDYLGLAHHAGLRESLTRATTLQSAGAAASRLISGTQTIHREAEDRLAQLARMPSALLFSSGYAANVGVLSTLPRDGDVIFSDALNHASVIDGCRLSRARTLVYPHCDMDGLCQLLQTQRSEHTHAFIVTDALFSMDGDRAPLTALQELAKRFDASLLVDEAHSLGVLGPKGAGACAEAGVTPDLLVGTLGKAMGLWGAFAASTPAVTQLLENSARSFVFSTATSPAGAAACVSACELVEAADDARRRLLRHASHLREGLRGRGWNVPASDAQIVPIIIGPADAPCVSPPPCSSGASSFRESARPPSPRARAGCASLPWRPTANP